MPKSKSARVICKLTRDEHERLTKKHIKSLTKNSRGCMVIQIVPSKEDGYAQVYVRPGLKVLAHHLAWFDDFDEITILDGYDVSHRCGETRCCNKEHLLYELARINQARKGCVGAVDCPCGNKIIVCRCHPDADKKCLQRPL